MRLFYTLIASGLLVLTEVPAEQPPPPVPYSTLESAGGMHAESSPFESLDSGRDGSSVLSGEWRPTDTPVLYQAPLVSSFPQSALQDKIEFYTTSYVESVAPEISAEQLESDMVAPATALPTATGKAEMSASKVAPTGKYSALPISGYAMYYNPNVMQEVVSNRMAMGQISLCDECVGTVALLSAGDINRRIWLEWPTGVVEGPFLVVDTAASHHVAMLLARKWVIDVDYATAQRNGMAGPVYVTVWGSPQPLGKMTSISAGADAPNSSSNLQVVARVQPSQYSSAPAATPLSAFSTVASVPASKSVIPIGTPEPAVDRDIPVGFPIDTATPTITPLPALNATPSSTPVVMTTELLSATATSSEIATPLPTAAAIPPPPATGAPSSTATPVPAETATGTATPSATMTPTPTATVTSSSTATPVPTETATSTATPALTPSATVTPIPTATAAFTPSATAIPVPTETSTSSATKTSTATTTATTSATATPIPTATATTTPSSTATLLPTATATMTPTVTILPAGTTLSLTATPTSVKGGFPTHTPVPTITPLPAIKSLPSPTATVVAK